MKEYQPIVLQRLGIRLPGLHVRRLALHRHLPETTVVAPHTHNFSQCLVYLSGRGVQIVRGARFTVVAGTMIFLPPKTRHAFRRGTPRRPICLVLDFDWDKGPIKEARVMGLSGRVLREVREQVVRIARQKHWSAGDPPPLHLSSLILALLQMLLAATIPPVAGVPERESALGRKVRSLLAVTVGSSAPLPELARRAGYQHDYLNRLLKAREGLTLGQMRARYLLAQAQRSLLGTESIAETAMAIGFSDPNYFARWFRKHAGVTPSEWRNGTSNG